MTQTPQRNGTDSVCATHGRPACPVCAYNADLDKRVAATPSRDWQKDMRQTEIAKELREIAKIDTEELDTTIYWLQEAKIYKQSYEATLTAYTAEKARADATEAREQRLKEAYEKMLKYLPKHVQAAYGFDEFLTTLYQDTPAPKEGE